MSWADTPLNAAAVGLIIFDIPDARTVPVVVLALNADPRIQFAQPDYVYDTHGQAVVASTEPFESLSYGARLAGADRIQDLVSGRGTRVALIDTGVDVDHVDLIDQISESRDFTGKGFSPDIHGTQVAGILAAKSGNGVGISGIAPGVTLLALKACQPSSQQSVRARCWSSALVKGIDYAVEQDVDIINLSVGGRREDQLLRVAVEVATGSNTVVVAAAGNDGPMPEGKCP